MKRTLKQLERAIEHACALLTQGAHILEGLEIDLKCRFF